MEKTTVEPTDEDCMIAYQAGSQADFETLFARYSGSMMGYFQNRARNRTLSEDLVQSAFLKLHQTRHLFDPKYSFRSWLFQICHSVWVDRIRTDLRKRAKESGQSEGELARIQAEPVHIEEAMDVASFLNNLAPREREILKLRMEGQDFQEISAVLHTRPANVRQWFHRAFRKGNSTL